MTPGTERPPGAGELDGVFVDLVTPLHPDRTLDGDGLEALLLRVASGVAPLGGVVPVGPAGEGPLLPLPLRSAVTKAVADHLPAAGHVLPLAVGTSPTSVLSELDVLADAGATGALVAPLSLYGMGGAEARGFFELVADRTPIPIVLYNRPQPSGVQIPLPAVAQLAPHPMIAGIADASGDMEYLSGLVLGAQCATTFSVLCGRESLLMPAVLLGASGVVAASANLVPALVSEVYGYSVTRSLHPARLAQRRLQAVVAACERPGWPHPWKAATSAAGWCGPTPALGDPQPGPEGVRRLRSELAGLGVLDAGN